MREPLISLTAKPSDYPPSAWASLAIHYEGLSWWSNAAAAWEKAESASAGHGRRARYAMCAANCRAKIKGE